MASAPPVQGSAPESDPVDMENNNEVKYKTEFHRLYFEFTTDVRSIRNTYPLATLISIVAFGIFGFFNVIRIFSPCAMIAGAMLLALSTSLAFSIAKDLSGFKDAVLNSLFDMKNIIFVSKKDAEPST